MEEVWKDIPNYNGYQVSNLGRVRTHNKITHTQKHGDRHWENRILKYKETNPKKHSKHQGKQGTGYRVDLWKNGKPKSFLVARLVAFTFYNKDINNHHLTVDHLNGNRLDNNIDNLEIVSLKENIKRSYINGLHKSHTTSIKVQFKDCGQPIYCYSMCEASRILGKGNSYISGCIKQGKFENKDAIWEII